MQEEHLVRINNFAAELRESETIRRGQMHSLLSNSLAATTTHTNATANTHLPHTHTYAQETADTQAQRHCYDQGHLNYINNAGMGAMPAETSMVQPRPTHDDHGQSRLDLSASFSEKPY